DAFGSSGTPVTGAAVTSSAGGAGAIGAAGVAGATLLGKGGGHAAAGGSTGKASRRRGLIQRLLHHSVHAEFVVKDGTSGYVTVDLDRGAVQTVSSTSITVLRPDGVTVTAAVTSGTKFV